MPELLETEDTSFGSPKSSAGHNRLGFVSFRLPRRKPEVQASHGQMTVDEPGPGKHSFVTVRFGHHSGQLLFSWS